MIPLKNVASAILSRTTTAYLRHHLSKPTTNRCFDRVCVVGAIWRRDGIAKGAVLQYEAFKRLGVDVELVDIKGAGRGLPKHVEHRTGTAYIFHSGGPQMASLLSSVLPEAKDAYRIAYWAWELPVPPRDWPDPGELVSEIWTCSSFSKSSLGSRWDCPIHVVPHVIDVNPPTESRSNETFNVLVVADSRSSALRKNVQGAIKAFSIAFRSNPRAMLTLKLNGVLEGLPLWIEEADCPGRINVVQRYLSDDEMAALYASSDVLLSMHRAEGFGLHLLEAMARGTAVVATSWSGNLDFMDDSNSILIDAKTTPIVDATVYPGYENDVWAEPDIGKAATALVELHDKPALRRELAAKGTERAQQLLSTWSYA